VQTAVAFLCTRVKEPDKDDYKKLVKVMQYIRRTQRHYADDSPKEYTPILTMEETIRGEDLELENLKEVMGKM